MQTRVFSVLCVLCTLAGCDNGVQLAKTAQTAANAPANTDPLSYSEPLIIDDIAARQYVPLGTAQAAMFTAQQCLSDQAIITPDNMSNTDGFTRDALSDAVQVDALRARFGGDENAAQYIELCVETDQERDYYIETRVRGPSTQEDSFFFTVNDGAPIVYDVGRSNQDYAGFSVDYVRSRDNDPLRITLEPGRNLLRFHLREPNTALASVTLLRLARPVRPVDNNNDSYSDNMLACAANVGQPVETVANLIDQHLPSTQPEYVLFANEFNDASLTENWRVLENLDQPRVYCLQTPNLVNTADGLKTVTNAVLGPFLAPTLILGSDGDDRVARNRAMNEFVTFYGFAGNDLVEWQLGGQFIGGDDNDTVIGLTRGSFDGGAGDNTVNAATSIAKVDNATIDMPNTAPPQAPVALEVVGLDDNGLYARWEKSANENVLNYQVITQRSDSARDNLFVTQGENRTAVISPSLTGPVSVSVRSVLDIDDGVSMLSNDAATISVTKPSADESIMQFAGERLRGPEAFTNFTDATRSIDQVRWLSSEPLYRNRRDDSQSVIEMRLSDQSLVQSLDYQTITSLIGGPFETPCNVFTGETTHFVVVMTQSGADIFGFAIDTLVLNWQTSVVLEPRDFQNCGSVFFADKDWLIIENINDDGKWIDTVRIDANGAIQRSPAPDVQSIRSGQPTPYTLINDTALTIKKQRSPDDTELVLISHSFDGNGTQSLSRTLNATGLADPADRLIDIERMVTDGTTLWVVGRGNESFRGAEYVHGIMRINIASGQVEAIKRFASLDFLFDRQTRQSLITLNDGVIEIGRTARVIRIDATSLARLPDSKAVGQVVAFDDDFIVTRVADESGVSAYRFGR